MNKFMKIAAVFFLVGVTIFVVRSGMKKSVDGSHTEITQINQQDQNGGQKTSESSDASKSASNGHGGETTELGNNGAGANDGDSFMGGVTGRSGEGAPSAGTTESAANGAASGANGSAGSTNGVSVPAGANVAGVAGGTTGAKEPGKTENNCFAFEYRHQKEALNKDIEDFLDYSNAFPILHDKVSQKSICVKVNGKPVAFKLGKYKDQQEVVIGSVVGPESVIRVSYCVGTSSCKEACAVKSNRFMDDLMSDAGDEDEFKEAWGDSKEQKKELQAKVKEFRSVASENKGLQRQSTIRSWDTIQKNEWVCKK